MNTFIFAQNTRNTLRSLQASRYGGDLRLDKSFKEIILEITWRVAEKLSDTKLPR